MSEHTPTPWIAMGNRGDIISVCKGFPERIVAKAAGQPTSNERAANAALIVRAVNSHAQLVAALEPFAEIASVKGGTDAAKEPRSVINRIMECAPYPDDLKAIEQFCNAILNARAVLDSIKDLSDA